VTVVSETPGVRRRLLGPGVCSSNGVGVLGRGDFGGLTVAEARQYAWLAGCSGCGVACARHGD